MPGSARSIRFHPAARRELVQAAGWYLDRSPTAAREFLRELDRALSRMSEAPERYRSRGTAAGGSC